MKAINVNGISFQIDDDGFLADTEVWDEKIARILAIREGINDLKDEQLTFKHASRR